MSHRETELFELGVCILSTPDSPTSYPAFEELLLGASDLPDFVVSDVGHKAWREVHAIITPLSSHKLTSLDDLIHEAVYGKVRHAL